MLNLLISEKKNGGKETVIQKQSEKRFYHLLKVQWLGLFLLHLSPQAPEQYFLLQYSKHHVGVFSKVDFFFFK